jgi:SAM-dependent methyltransferase
MARLDQYLHGYGRAEHQRLQRQAQMLAEDARRQFDWIGVSEGARVVEIGCGPQGNLDLLSELVGPGGSVTGIESNEDAARLARQFVSDRNLANVEVIHGDGRATGLPRGAFDLATARLVLVDAPRPEQIVAEMVALVRPGGKVAFYEADWSGGICDPPQPAWNRAFKLLQAYSSLNGIDLFVGRRIPQMLREAGLIDIQEDCIVSVIPQGNMHRTILSHFIESLRDRLLAQKIISGAELNDLLKELKRHIDDSQPLVVGGLLFQAWGRRPAQSEWEPE